MKTTQWFNFIAEFRRSKDKAQAIRSNEEQRVKSKVFGVSSILSSILCVAFAVLLGFGLKWLMDDALLSLILGIIAGLIGLAGTLAALYKAIESWAFQLYVNKRPITWISLALWILAIGGAVAVVIIIL